MPAGSKPKNVTSATRFIVIIAALILFVAGWFWYQKIHMSPNNVFWGMMNNNLVTSSVTRQTLENSQDRSVEQLIREQFGSVNAVATSVTLKQKTNDGNSIVKSQTIGTPDTDYSRYIKISTPQKDSKGKPIDTSKVVGIWGKTSDPKPNQASSAQYYKQSIMTIIPYGNFNSLQRKTLVDQMHDHSVYTYDTGSVKTVKVNNRSAYVYTVKIKPAAYIDLMKTYAKELGLGDLGLDPASYANSPDLTAELTIDKLSRQIVKINYPDAGQSENVIDQNLEQPISLPSKTISINELQDRIQKVSQ